LYTAEGIILHTFNIILQWNFSKDSSCKSILLCKGELIYMSTNSVGTDPGLTPAVPSTAEIKPNRYHPALVALHWLIAILVFGAFFLAQENEGGRERSRPGEGNFPPQGFQQGTPPQNFQAGNPPPGGFPQEGGQSILSKIGIHMVFGSIVLVLLIARLFVRWRTPLPEWLTAGNKFFDWIGNLTHWGLYILTFAMTITGIILADQRGTLARVFGIGSTPTPGSFRRGGFNLGMLHGGIWTLLLLFIILHVGAALYHQFIRRDHLLQRMWFGKSAG
jgi:cytochrome b561